MRRIGCYVLLLCFAGRVCAEGPEVKIGSKKFTESVVIGELLVHLARSSGAEVAHYKEMGGTRILWNALLSGDIDIYPEYTGTITQEILAGKGVGGLEQIRQALADRGLVGRAHAAEIPAQDSGQTRALCQSMLLTGVQVLLTAARPVKH